MRTRTRTRAGARRTSILVAAGLALFGLAGVGPAAAAHADSSQKSGTAALIASSAAARRAATADAGRQAELVTGEDQRLVEALLAGRPDVKHPDAGHQPYRVHSSGLLTLVLTKRRAPYTFDDLRNLAPETFLPQSDGSFLLREHILVAEGATLSISPRRPLVIKMSSGPEGFVSLVTQGGRLRLNGTAAAPITFESWDESHGRTDRDLTDGRAYIRVSGQLIAQHTVFSRLGFWSGRTGGVSVVGTGSMLGNDVDAGSNADSADDPVAEQSNSQTEVLPAGKLPSALQDPTQSFATQISDSTISGDAFGLFITGSSGPMISRTVITKSLVDGLVLHRGVDSANISDVKVELSGSDGVVVSREVEGTVLTRLDVRQNGRDGIVLTGRPLADGPSASGSSIRPFGNNVLTASQSSNNLGIGVHVVGGTSVRVQGNIVSGGRSGIVVSDGASDIDLDSNRVAGVATNGIQVRESQKVTVTGNVVRDSPTGIHIRNSTSTLRLNSTSGVTLHGITFVGAVAGSVVAQNLLAGSGTSAIDLVRVGSHQDPIVKQNDLSGWSRTVTSDSLISILLHPLTVIWIFVALALIAMSRPRRGLTRLPYRTDPLDRSATISIPLAPELPSVSDPVPVIPQRRSPARPAAPAPVPASLPFPEPFPEPVYVPAAVTSVRNSVSVKVPMPVRNRAAGTASHPVSSFGAGLGTHLGSDSGSAADTDADAGFNPGPALAPAALARSRRPAPAPPMTVSPFMPPPELPPAPFPPRGPGSSDRPEYQPDELEHEPAMAGSSVIDLAVRESRLSPATPRRRRAVGR